MRTPTFSATVNQARVGDDYIADVGYIRRKGYYEINPSVAYKFFPATGRLISHGPSLKFDMFRDTDFSLQDRQVQLGYSVEWQSRDTLFVDMRDNYVRLQAPFDPTNTGGRQFAAGTGFNWRGHGDSPTVSDSRKLLNYELGSRYGGYYGGTHWNMSGKSATGACSLSATWPSRVLMTRSPCRHPIAAQT